MDPKDRVPLNAASPEPGTEDTGQPTTRKHPDGQYVDHWVLSEEERAKGFQRPVRRSYYHGVCGGVTTMPQAIAETYAASPGYYGRTFCSRCQVYLPVGPDGEFTWMDGPRLTDEKVGS